MPDQLPITDRFNIRVYGLCIKNEQILMVNEVMNGFEFTKFPGGGLEFGEGLHQGLQREIEEELGLKAIILEHFYTTDFFQRSAFKQNEQLLSVYYIIDLPDCPPFEDFPIVNYQSDQHRLNFFWRPLKSVHYEEVTFPIDKLIIEKLKSWRQ